jgi:hypothetical protein
MVPVSQRVAGCSWRLRLRVDVALPYRIIFASKWALETVFFVGLAIELLIVARKRLMEPIFTSLHRDSYHY